MGLFNAKDIFEFAVQIEVNGEKFYREMAKKLDNTQVKELFNSLADEEIAHKKIFEKMASKLGSYKPSESYSGEYDSFMKAYTENIIFSHENLNKEIERIDDANSDISFAIKNEMQSILYYKEIKNFVPESEHNLIDKIIEEERKHFVKLTEIKKSMS